MREATRKDEKRGGGLFCIPLADLYQTRNHASMKTDVLSLKGEKRSGKLTIDGNIHDVTRESSILMMCSLLIF